MGCFARLEQYAGKPRKKQPAGVHRGVGFRLRERRDDFKRRVRERKTKKRSENNNISRFRSAHRRARASRRRRGKRGGDYKTADVHGVEERKEQSPLPPNERLQLYDVNV